MNEKDRKQPVATPAPAGESSGDGTPGSGKGASTALEALIRKRRMAEAPDEPEPRPPEKP